MLKRIPGLDGLRGIAVIAVIIYHADISQLAGGFLGVDVFFVLSGFLITSLLLDEMARTSMIDRANFYIRRIRRLFPALFLVLLFSVMISGLFVIDAAYHVRRDLPWALTFVLNWSYLFFEQSYFVNISRPPLLQHLWSLSVEEQFYVIWPLALIGLAKLRVGNLSTRTKVFVTSATLAIASSWWMTHLANANGYPIPNDPSRVYFGTDTHAMGLLIGAATAALWRSDKLNLKITPDRAAAMNLFGVVSLAGLLYFFIGVSELNPWLYRGGFLVLSLTTALLIVVAAHPGLKFGNYLGNQVLTWFGDRSYGIYLWHWPIFVLLRAGVDVSWPDPVALIVKFGLVLIVSDLSYRFIELPIRKGAIGSRLQIWKAAGVPRPQARTLATAGAGALVVFVSMFGLLSAPTPSAGNMTGLGGLTAIDEDPLIEAAAIEALSEDPGASPVTAIQRQDIPTVVFGDSVVLGAREGIKTSVENVSIDAEVGRQPKVIAERIRTRRTENRLGNNVVIHMGTNGSISEGDLKTILDELTDRGRVVVVNVRVPRVWMKPNNKMINEIIAQYPNVRLANWAATSKGHKGWFAPDGVHLTKTGAGEFGLMIHQALTAP